MKDKTLGWVYQGLLVVVSIIFGAMLYRDGHMGFLSRGLDSIGLPARGQVSAIVLAATPSSTPTTAPTATPKHTKTPRPTAAPTRTPHPTPTLQWYLHCPECAREGMLANIWADESMASVVCRKEWGSPVEMLDNSGSDTMYRVIYGDCHGWIRKTLVRYGGQ